MRRPLSAFGALTLCLCVAACGFHPLYAPSGATARQFRNIYVDVIFNRNGQLLRQALQDRLEGEGLDGSKAYELSVMLSFTTEAIGIQPDTSSNRTRFIGVATWTLKRPGPFGARLVSNTVRSVDGANVIDEQFFYSDLASEAIQRRMGDNLADGIVQQLAVYFRAHPEA